MSAIVQCDLY